MVMSSGVVVSRTPNASERTTPSCSCCMDNTRRSVRFGHRDCGVGAPYLDGGGFSRTAPTLDSVVVCPLALLAHVAVSSENVVHEATSSDMVVACTDERTAPSRTSGARDCVGKWTVNWIVPGRRSLAPLAHTAASDSVVVTRTSSASEQTAPSHSCGTRACVFGRRCCMSRRPHGPLSLLWPT